MINPCKDLCYKYNQREYSPECDTSCTYAAEVKRRKELEARMATAITELDNIIITQRSLLDQETDFRKEVDR